MNCWEGPPNIIHAGVIAALLDETMITVNKYLETIALTSELTVRYLEPAYVGENLYIWRMVREKKQARYRKQGRDRERKWKDSGQGQGQIHRVRRNSSAGLIFLCKQISRSGETGRRSGLKIRRWQHHEGSSPSFGKVITSYRIRGYDKQQ